jgi:hypothetical protein
MIMRLQDLIKDIPASPLNCKGVSHIYLLFFLLAPELPTRSVYREKHSLLGEIQLLKGKVLSISALLQFSLF